MSDKRKPPKPRFKAVCRRFWLNSMPDELNAMLLTITDHPDSGENWTERHLEIRGCYDASIRIDFSTGKYAAYPRSSVLRKAHKLREALDEIIESVETWG